VPDGSGLRVGQPRNKKQYAAYRIVAPPHKDRTSQTLCSIASPARHSFCAHWQSARRWQLWQTSVPLKSRTAAPATEPGMFGFRKISRVSKGAGILLRAGSSTCVSASDVVFEIMMSSVTSDAIRNKLHRREIKASYVPNKPPWLFTIT